MANLKALAGISGAAKGILSGLQYVREREDAFEEEQRQERDKRIQLLKFTLPHMKRDEARALLFREDLLGADDEDALMALAGTQLPRTDTRQEQISKVYDEINPNLDEGETAEDKYANIEKMTMLIPNLDKGERDLILDRAKKSLGIETEEKGYSFNEWRDDISRAKTADEFSGLQQYAQKNHPDWLGYAPKKFRKELKTSPKDNSTLVAQRRLLENNIKKTERRIEELDAIVNPGDMSFLEGSGFSKEDFVTVTPEQEAELEQKKKELEHYKNLQNQLVNPDAEPIKNFGKALIPPAEPTKPKPTKPKFEKEKQAHGVAQKLLQKGIKVTKKTIKAAELLDSEGYEITKERVAKVIQEGLI